MRERVSLVNRDGMGNAVARVEHDAGRSPRGVQGQYRLDGHVHRRRVERFEHNLRHFFPICLNNYINNYIYFFS